MGQWENEERRTLLRVRLFNCDLRRAIVLVAGTVQGVHFSAKDVILFATLWTVYKAVRGRWKGIGGVYMYMSVRSRHEMNWCDFHAAGEGLSLFINILKFQSWNLTTKPITPSHSRAESHELPNPSSALKLYSWCSLQYNSSLLN